MRIIIIHGDLGYLLLLLIKLVLLHSCTWHLAHRMEKIRKQIIFKIKNNILLRQRNVYDFFPRLIN